MIERKKPLIDSKKYVSVVDQLITLEELGFKEDGFHRWNYIIHDSPISRAVVCASGDYIFYENSDPSRKEGNPFKKDIVTLWNKDIAGTISKARLQVLLNILKQGNARKKK